MLLFSGVKRFDNTFIEPVQLDSYNIYSVSCSSILVTQSRSNNRKHVAMLLMITSTLVLSPMETGILFLV